MISTKTIDLKEFKTWCDRFIATSYAELKGTAKEKKKTVINFIKLKAANLQLESMNVLMLDELIIIAEQRLNIYLQSVSAT